VDWKITLSDIDMGNEELAAVESVLRSKWLTMGAITQEFENAVAAYVGAKHAIAVTNATAALHLACVVTGLGPGYDAIAPSLTFVATANAVRYTGADVVFADVADEQDLNISVEAIEKSITERTRAILVVHYGGYACDMPAILELARRHKLHVIEDAAHPFRSELQGKKLGTWGEVGCFSFFSNKNMTTAEGGMLVTSDDALAERLRLLRSHGMTTLTLDRHKGHAWSYDVVDLGYNYRIDEMRSAMGIVQLGRLERNNRRRREFTRLYHELLQNEAPRITVPFSSHLGVSAAHLMPILLPQGVDRTRFMEHMKSQKIQTSIHYPPIHLFSAYREMNGPQTAQLPVTEDVAARLVTLPLYPTMTDEDVLAVVSCASEGVSS